jgi:hypothetical protein
MSDEKKPAEMLQPEIPLHMGETGGDPFSHYSNHFALQITEHECFLTFLEFRPDMKVGNHFLRTAGARNVAEVVIPKHLFPVFLKVLQDTYERSKFPATEKKD